MSNNSTTEVRGKQMYRKGQYQIWLERSVAHVEDGGYVYLVNLDETGPRCYCDEFVTWGTCPHAVCILEATGEAEPVNED